MNDRINPAAAVAKLRRQTVEGFQSRVEDWLRSHIAGLENSRISSLHASAGGGLSGETYIVALDEHAPQARTVVLRKDVQDKTTNPQCNFDHLLVAQHFLGNIDGMGVPRVLGFEPDPDLLGTRFVVTDFVSGLIPSDVPSYATAGWVAEASTAQRSRLWQNGVDFLVRLHAVDHRGTPLEGLRFSAPGDDELERCAHHFVALLRREWPALPPICERAIAWLRDQRPALDRECLCWGDARIGNIIWRDFACAAVIDWDMCSIGHRGIDLGWWSFFHRWSTYGQGFAELDGLCTGQPLADLYAARGGLRIENFRYFEVLATVRGLSVWLRTYKAMRADGAVPEMDPLGDSIHMIRVLHALMDTAD